MIGTRHQARTEILNAIETIAAGGQHPVLVAFMNARGHVRMIAVDGLPVESFLRTLSTDPAPRWLGVAAGTETS
jgi:hypothetical protein